MGQRLLQNVVKTKDGLLVGSDSASCDFGNTEFKIPKFLDSFGFSRLETSYYLFVRVINL